MAKTPLKHRAVKKPQKGVSWNHPKMQNSLLGTWLFDQSRTVEIAEFTVHRSERSPPFSRTPLSRFEDEPRKIDDMSSLFACSRYLGNAPRINRVIDPEVLKSMGNEAYKQGRFLEALALYDRAITLDSNMATYDCNKSAALIGLGRLQQPIFECEEAIRLQPSYARAHSRLATIYFRLGEAEKALNCNKKVPYVDSEIAFQTQALQDHLDKCIEARKVSDWKTILQYP